MRKVLLKERVLSSENLPDWFEKLKQTYEDRDIKFVGGESSNEATIRILEVVNELLDSDLSSAAIVTHGNILSLLLNHFNREFGFDNWRLLSNPDVFVLESEGDCIVIKHIGRELVWLMLSKKKQESILVKKCQ